MPGMPGYPHVAQLGAGALFLDPRNLPKVDHFSGKDEEWAEWAFAFRSYMSLLGFEETMDATEKMDAPPDHSVMAESIAEKARLLFHLLVQLLRGKAKRLAMKCPRGQGYTLWWALVREYEAVVEGRHQAMLIHVMRPTWDVNMPAEKFNEALLQWELEVQQYEQQSGKTLHDDTKVAVVLSSAPKSLKHSIATGHPSNRSNYANLRAAVITVIMSERAYDGMGLKKYADSDAMQVDAIKGGGKGAKGVKGGGKDKGAKGGKKGKKGGKGHKNDSAKNPGGKVNKANNAAVLKPKTEWFEGYCNVCHKYGHRAAHCWHKVQKYRQLPTLTPRHPEQWEQVDKFARCMATVTSGHFQVGQRAGCVGHR